MVDALKTGDLLLCSSGPQQSWPFSWLSSLIKTASQSPYSHVAMVIKDPAFIHPSLCGLFVWESNYGNAIDPQDNSQKFGVRITPLRDFLEVYSAQKGVVVVRTLECDPEKLSALALEPIHNIVYNKPYDTNLADWIKVLDPNISWSVTDQRFWCSALIGYIYVKCGILAPDTLWSFLRPADFALSSERLKYKDANCFLSSVETRIV